MYVSVRAKATKPSLRTVSDSWKNHEATKVGAIVGGQTSCKAPELSAFDKHLPSDVEIVSCHSLHGPKVNPKGQPLVCRRMPSDSGVARIITDLLSPLGPHPASCVG